MNALAKGGLNPCFNGILKYYGGMMHDFYILS